jgi:hypothetical protein
MMRIWITNKVPYASRIEEGVPRRTRPRGRRMIPSHAELFFEQLTVILGMLLLAHLFWLGVIGLAWLLGGR